MVDLSIVNASWPEGTCFRPIQTLPITSFSLANLFPFFPILGPNIQCQKKSHRLVRCPKITISPSSSACSSFGESASTTATTDDDRVVHHGKFLGSIRRTETIGSKAMESQRKGMVHFRSSFLNQLLIFDVCRRIVFACWFGLAVLIFCVSGTAEQKLVQRRANPPEACKFCNVVAESWKYMKTLSFGFTLW